MRSLARAAFVTLVLAASVALADGPPEDESLVPGWQQGLRAVFTVVLVVAVAVVARRLGSRASSRSANRRRGENPDDEPSDRL